jgi:hypothetical protein
MRSPNHSSTSDRPLFHCGIETLKRLSDGRGPGDERGMKKALRGERSFSRIRNPTIDILWGKTMSDYSIRVNIVKKRSNLLILRSGLPSNLCILFCIMGWGLVVQVRNVSNVRQNEEHHHEGQDAAS